MRSPPPADVWLQLIKETGHQFYCVSLKIDGQGDMPPEMVINKVADALIIISLMHLHS